MVRGLVGYAPALSNGGGFSRCQLVQCRMKKVKILHRAISIGDGKVANAGDIVDVSDEIADYIVAVGRAEIAKYEPIKTRVVSEETEPVSRLSPRRGARSRD